MKWPDGGFPSSSSSTSWNTVLWASHSGCCLAATWGSGRGGAMGVTDSEKGKESVWVG